MGRYVPARASNGDLVGIEYVNADGALVGTRDYAKPLVGVYLYGPVEGVEGVGFAGHGKRDAYAAVSLDDGETWKRTNLSRSADKSSSQVVRTDVEIFADTGYHYPGDVVNIFQATAGDRAIVVWPSRYCRGGNPNFALGSDAEMQDLIADVLGVDLDAPSPDDLYLLDMFGVAGSQGSVDYAKDQFEQNHPVGEVPYTCLWAARGTLEEVEEGLYEMIWRQPERLTSGRRDVNRVEVKMVPGAGAAVTWQEDPEGLRPGQGEGPGEGWSGAIANSQTDIWYSYIGWDHFDLILTDTGEIAPLDPADPDQVTGRPQAAIPMAMPMRLTDNARCNPDNPLPYCNGSAIASTEVLNPLDYGLKDLCADTVEIPTGPQNTLSRICVTENGLPLVGNIASTRPRLNLFGYDSSMSQTEGVDSAWAVVVAEESKGLGSFGFTDDGNPCDPETDAECTIADIGKNMWYYSFGFSLTDASANNEDGLLANLVNHGNMLNQPEIDWMTGELYPVMSTEDMWNFGDYNYELYKTEIARRGSLLAQPIEKVARGSAARSGLLALPAWKQGIMRQGGPADVMLRRIIMPEGYQPFSAENPYHFRNMDCAEWAYADGENPYYPDGICLSSAINVSATVPDLCVDSTTGASLDCPSVDEAGIADTNPILQGSDVEEANTTKVLAWHQCPHEGGLVSGLTTPSCAEDARPGESTLADQSWYNPLDVAKGHRGYLDGDFAMLLYAWSPNWRLNVKGRDRYELYIRRSFDGGLTWTTQPRNYLHWDATVFNGEGSVSCETFRAGESQTGGETTEPRACFEYSAGASEQARNVSQLKSMRFTILDPRYSPTKASILEPVYSEEDERDPSRYFIVYETGDNTTTIDGEPEPLDLFYSRAVLFGDHYQVWAEEDGLDECYPSNPHDDADVPEELVGSGFCNEFDELEGKKGVESSEASVEANPGGEFLYAVWAQLELDDQTHELVESDAMFRRVWYLDDYIPTDAWGGDGQGPGQSPGNGSGSYLMLLIKEMNE
jgi:hypothetical protein